MSFEKKGWVIVSDVDDYVHGTPVIAKKHSLIFTLRSEAVAYRDWLIPAEVRSVNKVRRATLIIHDLPERKKRSKT